jgi:hypothetical protein
VTTNGRQLLWMAGLILVFLYIYSVAEFTFLRDDLTKGNGKHMWCETAWQVYPLQFLINT